MHFAGFNLKGLSAHLACHVGRSLLDGEEGRHDVRNEVHLLVFDVLLVSEALNEGAVVGSIGCFKESGGYVDHNEHWLGEGSLTDGHCF